MIDIEGLLKIQTLKPGRELSANFTEQIVRHLETHPRENGLDHRWKAALHWLRRRVGLLSVASLLVAGAAAAATVATWPTPSVQQVVADKLLPNGDRIVGYNTQNCDYFSNGELGKPVNTSENVYYEVRKDSSLTDQQLQSALQGVCEENVSNGAVSRLKHHIDQEDGAAAHKNMSSTGALRVKSVTATSITVSADPTYSAPVALLSEPPHDITYTHFASHLRVYDNSTAITFGDIKVGDDVKLLTDITNGGNGFLPLPPECVVTPDEKAFVVLPQDREKCQPQPDLDHQVVYGILKIPRLTGDPSRFYSAVGTDLVRTEPCTTNSTGFCQAYQFD